MIAELNTLREDALTCQRCALCSHRKNVVFGEGDPCSPLTVVGEGPGEQEDLTGRPFVGRAGQLLDRALDEAGVGRHGVYITNTVKCRAADWTTGKPVNRPPTEEEALSCRQWLLPQIALLRPMVILCVGASSAKYLIRKDFKITKERGLFFRCEFAKTAIATLHPSFILRQANVNHDDGGYNLLVADIKKAWEGACRLRDNRLTAAG